MTQPDHYQSAEMLLAMADTSAARAADATGHDLTTALAALAGSVVHVLAAQVHATLAVADALRTDPTCTG